MYKELSMTRVIPQCLEMVFHLFESRFALRKEVPIISSQPEECAVFLWRILIIFWWAFCIYMRNYDTILRGCSPIASETVILLLRVILVDNEVMMKREELMGSSGGGGGGYSHRIHSTVNSGVRHGALQQKQKERIGLRTAFALEQFIWFIFLIFTIDLTNINRASVALFLAHTLQWSRLGPKTVLFCIGIYALTTYFWYPAYSLQDTFLILSGQSSWVYKVYSSFGLAFSITLFLTETQCLQRVRRAGLWKVVMIFRALEKSVVNTPLSELSAAMRCLADYFFFVGFNFFMALCTWFSIMMVEWTTERSFTSMLCAIYAIGAIFRDVWRCGFHRMLPETIICLAMYIAIAAFVGLCIPTESLHFAANGVSSAFFVLYMAAHSPRRVHSSQPLVMVWLGMLAVNTYWHVTRSGMYALHMTWDKKLLCVNTITCGCLCLLSTALHVYRWEWPVEASTAPFSVAANSVSKVTSFARTEQKPKEKNNNSISFLSPTLEKAAVATLVTTTVVGKRGSGGGEKAATSFMLSSSSSSMNIRPVDLATLAVPTALTGMHVVESDKRCEASGECNVMSSTNSFEKQLTLTSDENTFTENPSCEDTQDPQTNSTVSEHDEEEVEEEVMEEEEEVVGEEEVVEEEVEEEEEEVVEEEEEEEEVVEEEEEEMENDTTEETVDAETTQEESNDNQTTRHTDSKETAVTTPTAKTEKKEELPQRNAFTKQTSSLSASPLPQSKRRSGNTETLINVRPSPRSAVESSPMKTGSSDSSEEQRGSHSHTVVGAVLAVKGKKATGRVSPTKYGNKKGDRGNSRVAAVAMSVEGNQSAEKESASSSIQTLERVVQVMLPLETIKTPPGAIPLHKKTAAQTSSARRAAAAEKVTNTRKENNNKLALQRETAAVSQPLPPSRVSFSKAATETAAGSKAQLNKKGSLRGELTAAEFKAQKSLSSQNKKNEDKRRAGESMASKIIPNSTQTSREGSTRINGRSPEMHRVPKETPSLVIPQPRSALNNMKANSASALTVPAVKSIKQEKRTWTKQQTSMRGEKEENNWVRGNQENHNYDLSDGDDDVSLDLGKLHIVAVSEAETELNVSRRRGMNSSIETSNSIPQATLHSLENFAKAYMPRTSAFNPMDTEGNAENSNHASLLEAVSSANSVHSKSPYAEPRSSVTQQQIPTQILQLNSAQDGRSAVPYQQTNSALQPHVNTNTCMESHPMMMSQNPMQQQVPVVLVAMGDGRLTYCPVIPSSYPTATQIMIQPQHMDSAAMQQQQQQQGVMYQQVQLTHPQHSYSGAWQHVNQR